MPVIAAITEQGFMTGYEGRFNPDGKLTRAQAVNILAPAFQLSGQAPIPYADIPANHKAAAAIQALLANQIVFPAKNETFSSNAMMASG